MRNLESLNKKMTSPKAAPGEGRVTRAGRRVADRLPSMLRGPSSDSAACHAGPWPCRPASLYLARSKSISSSNPDLAVAPGSVDDEVSRILASKVGRVGPWSL